MLRPSHSDTVRMIRPTRMSGAPGVRLLFACVTLVPLLGLGWLAVSDVADASEQVDRTERLAERAGHVDASIHAQALIAAEQYWAHAVASVIEFELPLDLISDLSGLDLETSYAEAQLRVDVAVAENHVLQGEAGEQLREARTLVRPGTENVVISAAYRRVAATVAASINDDLDEIRAQASGVRNATELTHSVTILELSVELRAAVSRMTEAYFSYRFPLVSDPSDEAKVLLQALIGYESDLDDLRLIVPDVSPLKPLWMSVDADPDVVAFFGRVEALTTGVLTSGAEAPSPGLALADVASEADAFLGSMDAVDRHVDFVAAASAEVVEQSEVVRSEAAASRNRIVAFSLGLGTAALVAVAGASLWIVRPLRRMASVVAKLREGELGGRVREAGPAEVRAAARALNEAVESMSVAERMATALAERDLQSPSLQLETTGRLGASLREAVSALATSMAEREDFRERLAHEATHDGLTGIANRLDTMAHLGQAIGRFQRSDKELAVLFVDVDGFKSVNDTHGHAAGDQVLRTIAKRVQEAIRVGDHVGRIGGDEFVLVAEPIDDLETALRLAARVLDAIAEPLSFNGMSLTISASIGVALATQSSSPEELLRDADLALYAAKAEGRARVKFCDAVLKARQQQLVTTEKALERAIEADELELHFQPIVDALSAELCSVEALLRWPQPLGGFAPPSEFIPIAERSHLILDVDRWVLRAIAIQLREWDGHAQLGAITASVNISARHLSVPSLVEEVLEPLRSCGVDPGRLTIEITETALLEDLDQAVLSLSLLRAEGVRVAIDDFGTGYASLAHLRRLPIDILKIDQSFVAGLDRNDDRSLVQLTIDTGHLLGASITAEGVETESQARQLTDMGTDLLQGFGVGRPMPAEQLDQWVAGKKASGASAWTAPTRIRTAHELLG